MGQLAYKFGDHHDQLDVYRQIQASESRLFVMEIARRWGKTWLLVVMAVETCLRNPGGRVVYGAPTLKHLKEFILPIFRTVIADSPPQFRPVWNASDSHWVFPNGAHVHLFGADDETAAERGRGPESHLNIFDEAGFTPVLGYVLSDVFAAMTLHSGGRTILGSTPARELDHDFTRIAAIAELEGAYARRTIHDNPRLTPEKIRRFIEDEAKVWGLSPDEFVKTDTFRREYMAERVIDYLLVVVPEWEEKRKTLIEAIPRPKYFDGMTVLDFGGVDPHAVHFAYWHHGLQKHVVEAELLLRNGENTELLAKAIKDKERAVWGTELWDGTLRGAYHDADERLLQCMPEFLADILRKEVAFDAQPRERWADNDLQLVRDLYELHRIAFIPTQKDDKHLAVNNLRVAVNKGEFILHPSCIETDKQMRTTTWANHKRKTFARKDGNHGDLVDCSTYSIRNQTRRNPEHGRAFARLPGKHHQRNSLALALTGRR